MGFVSDLKSETFLLLQTKIENHRTKTYTAYIIVSDIITFLASETGGCGNEQETLGNVPSSKVQSSTLKHLQLLRRANFRPFPLLSCLNPPNRGAPGVPGVAGVAGVEGADGTSSLSILT